MKLGRRRSRFAVLLFALLVAAACGSGSADNPNPEKGSVRGMIVEVVGRDLLEIELLRVRDDEGKVWTFTTEEFVGISPSHLRQHQVMGEGILVSYVAKGGVLVATALSD